MTTDPTTTRLDDLAPPRDDVDGRAIVTLRLLACDAVETAGSGHPGMPMGMAPAAWVLWSRFLRFDPSRPGWPDRDRFVLSAGHGSMLLYGLLHLFGFDLPLQELRRFRQWGSRTPGHPEYGITPGVETTTGPLGQGLGNAVGMALAERLLAARYNAASEDPVVDHRTYVMASDGDLMEGISHESASLAGHLGLGRLIVLYDDNSITIDGTTDLSYSDDASARFTSYGWHVQTVNDGNDLSVLESAIRSAVADDRPSLLRVRTHIGFGAPDVQDTSDAHGAPLGPEQLRRVKERFGADPERSFVVPEDVRERGADIGELGRRDRVRWETVFRRWQDAHPELAEEWRRVHSHELPPDIDAGMPTFAPDARLATRDASGAVLAELGECLPELVGGSADLAGSTRTTKPETTDVTRDDRTGRRIHFGVREHAMAAACNGLALHGGLRPYGATFGVFSDYARPAIRLSALMELPVVYLFTHDSIGVGEDGPTHQPVEQLAALRAIPNLAVLRPADAHETVEAWRLALRRTDGPTALFLTRQKLPVLEAPPVDAIARDGAWVVRDTDGPPDVVLIASGSEVWKAIEAADILAADQDQVAARVLSMPWRERFTELTPERAGVLLPPGTPRVVIEAGVPQGWEGIAGQDGRMITISRFGASAPGDRVMHELGFTAEAIAAAAREVRAPVDTSPARTLEEVS